MINNVRDIAIIRGEKMSTREIFKKIGQFISHANVISKWRWGKKLHVSWKINNHLPSFYFYYFCSIRLIIFCKQISLFNSILLLFILFIKFNNFWDYKLFKISILSLKLFVAFSYYTYFVWVLKLQIMEMFVKK